jgi:Recombination endonuclease VII
VKKCCRCRELKDISEFYSAGRRCKMCVSEISRKQYRKNPRRVKANNVARWYGLSLEEYERKFKDQGGRCSACGDTMKRACLDHCHVTGVPRDFLCDACNKAEGLLKTPLRALALVEYMVRHQESYVN